MPTKSDNAANLTEWLCVIPSRLGSTRMAEKALADLGGKPLVVRVYERTKTLRDKGAEVLVATDSDRIMEVCRTHGVPSVMTLASHQSGSDRCYEVAAKSPRPYVLNVQGDEPFVVVEDLLSLIGLMQRRPFIGMGTLAVELSDLDLFRDPNTVKVVATSDQRALYFSRSAIPHIRMAESSGRDTHKIQVPFMAHVGVYAFRKEALKEFVNLPKSSLEVREGLEQLRALENGMEIIVERATKLPLNINTEEDLRCAQEFFRN